MHCELLRRHGRLVSTTVKLRPGLFWTRVHVLQVAGILTNDTELLGRSLDGEVVVEAARGPLIPGFAAVKAAAKAAGAFGCTISGAGPTAVAIVSDPAVGKKVADAMSAAFKSAGHLETNTAQVVKLDMIGARSVPVKQRAFM